MEAHHQRLERRLGDVVEFVDGEQDTRAVVAGHLAQFDEETGEVGPEVAGVGRPGDGVDVDRELGSVGELEVERLEDPECPHDALTDPSLRVHRQEHPAEPRGQAGGELAVLTDLDVLVEVAPAPGALLELVEHHRLADPAEPGQELAAAVPTEQEPLQGDVYGVDLAVPAHQCGGTGAGARAVRVPDGVHAPSVSADGAFIVNSL